MKRIVLMSLILRDFQGGNFALNANGDDVNVFGINGSGKTRLASAWSWLLFDKDSLGRSDFQIKNTDKEGEAAHGLEHSVEGVLDVNGVTVTLKKVYKEIWSKKRGSATDTFTGHTTKYAIDGVPVQKNEYSARITEIAGDEAAFRLLTSSTVFPSLHWEKQRSLLLEICGDISDADVIASNAKLAPLPGILGKRKLDDHRKVITALRAEINKELNALPVRIDEQRRSLPDVTGLDRAQINEDIKTLETEINAAKLKLQGVETGGSIASLTKALAGVNADLQKMESEHYSETMKKASHLASDIAEVNHLINTNRNRLATFDSELKRKTAFSDRINADLADLRGKWAVADSQEFHDAVAETCAACGQSLPAERVQEARDKALAAFNQQKAERLEEINGRGLRLKEDKELLQGEIDAMTVERNIIVDGLPGHEAALQSATSEREAVKRMAEDYTTIPAREALIIQKSEIETAITAERKGRKTDTVKVENAIAIDMIKLTGKKADADKFTRRETGEQRIETLMDQEKVLAAEYEKLESELYLCEQFIKTKVSLLTDRINGQFEIARFKLFNQNINGGIEPCCEITVNGIPYNAGLNNAARINAGLDVCRTLSRHYGILAPIFVDNAESVVNLIAMDAQVVRLVVSAADPILRVEMARELVVL